MKIKKSQLTNLILETVLEELGPKSNIEYITPSQAKELIQKTNGSIFDVSFTKKDGSLRRMNARLGVKKHLKGGSLKFNPESKGLVVVYDVQCGLKKKSDDDRSCYRMININTLKSLRVGKQKYIINPEGKDPGQVPAV